MAGLRYSVGDKVLASRDESGEDHEPGVVVDSYEIIIGEERRPVVVVEFEDGERKYMTATTPNVLPVEEEEEEEAEAAEGESAEDEAEAEADEGEADEDLLDEDAEEAAAAEANGNGTVALDDEDEGASP